MDFFDVGSRGMRDHQACAGIAPRQRSDRSRGKLAGGVAWVALTEILESDGEDRRQAGHRGGRHGHPHLGSRGVEGLVLRIEPHRRRLAGQGQVHILLPAGKPRMDGGDAAKPRARGRQRPEQSGVSRRGILIKDRRQIADPRFVDPEAIHLPQQCVRSRLIEVPVGIGSYEGGDVNHRHRRLPRGTGPRRCRPECARGRPRADRVLRGISASPSPSPS